MSPYILLFLVAAAWAQNERTCEDVVKDQKVCQENSHTSCQQHCFGHEFPQPPQDPQEQTRDARALGAAPSPPEGDAVVPVPQPGVDSLKCLFESRPKGEKHCIPKTRLSPPPVTCLNHQYISCVQGWLNADAACKAINEEAVVCARNVCLCMYDFLKQSCPGAPLPECPPLLNAN